MSGSSTLRICLAAMAPALTEAATARLKLQDPSAKNESLSIIKSDKKVNEHNIPVSNGDLNTLGVHQRSNDRLVSRLSITKGKEDINGTSDPRRSTPLTTTTSPQTLTISSHISTFRSIKQLKHIEQFYAFEFQQGDICIQKEQKSDTHIDDLKIMNQPRLAADKQIEQSKAEPLVGDVDKLLNSSQVTKIKILPPVMVNGEEVSCQRERDGFLKDCDEKGDAPVRNGIQLNTEERSIIFSKDCKLNTSVKMGISLKQDQGLKQVVMESIASKSETQPEERSKEDIRKDCVKKQAYLERHVDNLLRRLKRMKGKVVEAHTKEQLRYFVNFQHKNLQNVAKAIKNETPGPAELKEHFLSNEDVKNMSAAQLVKLVKNYQPSRATQLSEKTPKLNMVTSGSVIMDPLIRCAALKTSEKLSHRVEITAAELDSDATASSSGGESGDEDSLGLPSNHLSAEMPPLLKRAEWKWAMDRSAVVSRWTWLQAQVSDLEYRIRQQSQIHRQLRNSKGGVVLGDPPSTAEMLRRIQGIQPKAAGVNNTGDKLPEGSIVCEVSPCNVSAVMSNVDKQASRLTQSLGNCLSPASSLIGSPAGSSKISSPYVNGLTESPCSVATTDTETTAEDSPLVSSERLSAKSYDSEHNTSVDATCQSARCRPLRSYRKRKILKTIGLYKTNSKAARLSDVRCRCYPPANPCPICGGRYNNTLTVDPDTMPFKERVALLDPSFHPVLSFPQDIHLPIHCEGLLKSGMWQNKPLPRRARVGDYRRQKVIALVAEPVRKNGNRQNGKNNSASVINFSAKIKNKYEGKTKGNSTSTKGASLKPRVNKAKRKAVKAAKDALRRNQHDEEDDELEALFLDQESGMSSHRDNGLFCSASQSSLKDLREGHHRKRKVDNSFDINNIVIPLSMAASTRIEQPQYKEIVTPKWRELPKSLTVVEDNELTLTQQLEKTNGVTLPVEPLILDDAEDEPDEDLSDERYAARHLALEQEEKKRFRNFVQYPPVRRNRARSEANPSKPIDRNGAEEGTPTHTALIEDSSVSSRPPTPVLNKCPQGTNTDDSLVECQQNNISARRRTVSFSKRDRSSSVIFDDIHNSLIDCGGVEPWPRRTFPISEDEYHLMREELPPSCEPVHQRVTRRLAEPSGKIYVGGNVDNQEDASAVPSPHPSNESVSSIGEDPNDPEWIGGEAPKRCRMRRTLNDDPSDPEWTGSDTPRKSKNKR
ncbi:unnamed protein product [Lymnaea stagnalis]|uniref:PEHE domain-containing protein n=1 Tax=Lymnaea stagnalis TaxID=6523 RepID=A0AAV2IRV1_LYMST